LLSFTEQHGLSHIYIFVFPQKDASKPATILFPDEEEAESKNLQREAHGDIPAAV
jgi:hypothetical protein